MRRLSAAACLLAAVAAAGPALAQAPARTPASAAATQDSAADEALRALFRQSDEDNLRRNPLSAIFRGDLRYADRLGDYLTDDYYDAERAAAEQSLAALQRINKAALTPTNQIAYDVFEYQQRESLRQLDPAILALTAVRPVDHFSGFQTFYPSFASGQGAAPFRTVLDYENNIKRHADYVRLTDRSIARLREGMASGVTQPKLIVRNTIEQLDQLIAQDTQASTFYGPVRDFPDSIPAGERERLRAETVRAIEQINAAHTRLRDFLRDTYLPAARDTVGLGGMPGGDRLYAALIEQNTTLPLDAATIHAQGLAEVARIRGQMEAIQRELGFQGTLAQFFEHLRTDPAYRPASAQALIDGFQAIGRRVDARVGEQFSTIPQTPLEIRPVEAYRERGAAAGSYQDGVWDPADPAKNRPGVFYFNTYDLPSRNTYGMETLYLHEAVPGHHFQISLAQENTALPAFMRYGGNTAFVEGWALYAETLWQELGMEQEPLQRFGGLDDEMLRAMRLVVDTGIHAYGWDRDRAIAYMLENSSMGRTDATIEVDRYIAIPGQALAYKTGQLTISRLKAEAQQALGDRFDPRAFHAEVLMTGALPLPVLEQKIDGWVANSRR
ncbi:uncharacterized protein (DUF885 family) [Sphingomonas jejuensis]|uniref:Uncharacterized protein (DUF885 family) n=1 Tax=Sphingomonas jejuensis TaxID=904715 RepID=A0ABX0XNL9_9SPHN|nr:DUF885 domain-containing protein [Sphingomonas jejuensis]NJC34870.1 uncharacterized protein (DUF885 family) [Sphingomonas jejuensis]